MKDVGIFVLLYPANDLKFKIMITVLLLSIQAHLKELFSSKSTSMRQGFTIVELLIVVVVIAILAAITVVSYNGITNQAIKATLQSDLQSASTQLESTSIQQGSYPADDSSAGLRASGDNTISYVAKSYGFCVMATNTRISTPLRLKSTNNLISEGNCDTTVGTSAGTGGTAYVDGPTSSAQIYAPQSIAVDGNKNIYVSDYSHRIRKITSMITVSTLAGSGSSGFANGTGTAAQFARPKGVAVDSAGNVYVADRDNHRIRKITPAGVVSTFAGTGSNGFTDGDGTVARFNNPEGLAIGADDSIYVADASNLRIRKITSTGMVSTVATTPNTPYGVAVDSSNNIYFSTMPAVHAIYKVVGGSAMLLAGSSAGSADGTGSAAQFNYPYSIAVDAYKNVYVADYINSKIRQINSDGVVKTLVGSSSGYVDGNANTARFSFPIGIAIDSSNTLYVADMTNNRIRKIEQ